MAQEMTVPVDCARAREALSARCPAPKRSQIDDTLYRRPDGAMARLRRQDTVTRLSCSRPDIVGGAAETIVLDHPASRRLLELLGFEAVDRKGCGARAGCDDGPTEAERGSVDVNGIGPREPCITEKNVDAAFAREAFRRIDRADVRAETPHALHDGGKLHADVAVNTDAKPRRVP